MKDKEKIKKSAFDRASNEIKKCTNVGNFLIDEMVEQYYVMALEDSEMADIGDFETYLTNIIIRAICSTYLMYSDAVPEEDAIKLKELKYSLHKGLW